MDNRPVTSPSVLLGTITPFPVEISNLSSSSSLSSISEETFLPLLLTPTFNSYSTFSDPALSTLFDNTIILNSDPNNFSSLSSISGDTFLPLPSNPTSSSSSNFSDPALSTLFDN